MRKSILSVIALFVLFASAHAADTMVLWVRSDGSAFMPPMVNRFNELHEEQIKLEVVPQQELVRKFATAAAAGEAPDLLSLDLIYAPQLIEAELVEDITDYAKSLPYFEHLSKAHLRLGSKDGRIYGLPFAAETSFLLYNKGLFRQAGLDPEKPPMNFEEWEKAAVAVAGLGGDIYGFYSSLASGGNQSFTFLPVIWASGGDVLNEDGSKVTLDSQAVKDALAFYRSMYKKGALPESSQSDAGPNRLGLFAAGKLGIVNGGTFNSTGILNDHPEIDLGWTPIPGKNGGYATFSGGENIVIPKGSTKMAVAKKFIEWSYSLEGQTILAQNGSVPPRLDVSAEALKNNHPVYLMAAKLLETGQTPYSPWYMELFNNNNSIWVEMIHRGIFSDEDIDVVTREATEQMQEIVDAYLQQ